MFSFDVIAIAIVSISIIYSAWKGMVREVFSLIALGVAYLAALNFYQDVASLMDEVITNEAVAHILSFIVLFMVCLLGIAVLGRWAKKFLYSTHTISGWDRFLGGFFGMAKGILILIVFMIPLQWFDETYARWTEDSKVAPYLENWVEGIREVAEPGFNRSWAGSLKGVEKHVPDFSRIEHEMAKQKDKMEKTFSSMSIDKWPPQESHTQEDRDNLDKIINQVVGDSRGQDH